MNIHVSFATIYKLFNLNFNGFYSEILIKYLKL